MFKCLFNIRTAKISPSSFQEFVSGPLLLNRKSFE
jgi:hypothetical protein